MREHFDQEEPLKFKAVDEYDLLQCHGCWVLWIHSCSFSIICINIWESRRLFLGYCFWTDDTAHLSLFTDGLHLILPSIVELRISLTDMRLFCLSSHNLTVKEAVNEKTSAGINGSQLGVENIWFMRSKYAFYLYFIHLLSIRFKMVKLCSKCNFLRFNFYWASKKHLLSLGLDLYPLLLRFQHPKWIKSLSSLVSWKS